MSLPVDLISQFAKATKDDKKTKSESTVYGTTVEYDGKMYVRLDGSELLTPVTTTTNMEPGERVTVLIKNHSATVTGNITSPSATSGDVSALDKALGELNDKVAVFDSIVAGTVTTEQLNAEKARIDQLKAEDVIIKGTLTAAEADIDSLQADNVIVKDTLLAVEADIESLEAENVNVKNTLTATNGAIENLKSTKIDTEIANARFATIENLNATNATIHNLQGTYANFVVTTTDKFTAIDGDISKLHSDKLDASIADMTYATIGDLSASNAIITNLESTFAQFEVTTSDKLNAADASIKRLDAEKLSAKDIDGKFANIDFTNIGKAAMEYFYANSGLIENVVVGDQTITGKLVGVTIHGDLIEGNTIVAEKLVIKGNDGLYYKLNTDGVKTEAEQTDYNSLNGEIFRARSIAATKIAVDDLVAFDATIGGFHIGESSIYSGVKTSATNSTRGVYLDKDGQMSFGDSENYVKYYKDQNGVYKLEISADSVTIGSSNKNIETIINNISEASTNNATDLANYIAETNAELKNLQGQIDGSIMTWFYEYPPTNSNQPASQWTTVDLKNNHLGDLFYDTITGYCYRWQVENNTYSWNRITDVDVTKALADAAAAQSTADNKRRVFVSTPVPPYDVGDLWTQGSSGDLMRCQTAKTSSQSYAASDWVKASKYTDDTKANAAQAAANAAQADVNAVEVRMTSAETQITQNKNQIALMASKTELTETLEGYYTKSQADAAIKVSSDAISQNVSSTYATKTALNTTNSNVTTAQNTANEAKNSINNLKIGGRNLATGTSDEWTNVNVGSWSGALYHTVNGINSFTHSYDDYGVKAGEYITFSVDLSAAGKRIAIRVDHATDGGSTANVGNYIEAGETGRSVLSIPVKSEYDSFKVYIGSDGSVSETITQQYKCFKVEKGNRSTDWSPAPEDVEAGIAAAQETADEAQNGVTALETRVTEAETSINQNSSAIALRATKTEVSTAKSEAISTAAADATTKANNAKNSAISTAAADATTKANNAKESAISTASADATTKANNALSTAKTYADAQIKISSDSIISTVNSVKSTAEAANTYTTNAKNNHGYQYKTTITINGDSSMYYPVLILGGDQNVMREIMVKRAYSDKAPTDWNGHPSAKGISLLLKIKCNFGGWGGANYSWVIHELEEMYGNVFASASRVMDNMGFVIFLRGGGETGALYHIFSDQQLDRTYMNGTSVRVCYDQELIGWSGGTADDPTYTWYAPAPRTLTDAIKKEIASKKYIDVATAAQNGVDALATRVTTAESKIQQNADSIELRATKTELATANTAIANAQSTANTANSTANANKTNLANNYYTKTQTDAKIKVESDKISSAVTRIGATETAISTLQQTADGFEARLDTTDGKVATAQSTANTANTTANSVKTDLANNYTKKSLPDTRDDNQPPSWYFENYPKQIITEFKYCSKIGLSGVGNYCTLQTIVPWTDSSGGYPKQTAKVESTGKEYWRVGTSADAWSSWIDPYGVATTANTTANTANTNAVNAQTTANTANTNAANAQSTANTARTEAANAAKTATNYLGFSSSGLVVGDMTASSLGKNVLIDSDSVDIRNGTTTLASFGASTIYLGKNSTTSVINLCNGSATMKVVDNKDFRIYTDKRLVMSAYDSMLMDCYRDGTHMTRIAIQSSDPDTASVVGGVQFTIYQGAIENTVKMLKNNIELKVINDTNESRLNVDEKVIKMYAADRVRLNSKSSIQVGESSSYSAGILLGYTYVQNKSINIYWSDGAIHDMLANANGQTTYVGPGDIDEATTTNLRGKYVRLYAHSGGGVYLGYSGSTAITSDRNMKTDIFDIDDKYLDFFDRLRPITYKYDCPENKGHRDHVGFIAQEVEEALLASGLTTEQFAGLVIEHDLTLNPNYDTSLSDEENAANETRYETLYSLRYEEFISLLVKKVQSLQEQINRLGGNYGTGVDEAL